MKTTDSQQVEALEQAILERAQELANEFLTKADRRRDDIQRETAEHLRLAEEREVLSAKVEADRINRRRVQAGELKMQAQLDQLRWELVMEIQARLTEQMQQLRNNRSAYSDWLTELVREGAELIPDSDLLAEVDEQDLSWLPDVWDTLVEEAAPGRTITLSTKPCPSAGGIKLISSDRCRRVDNRFEGRLARMEEEIQRVILRQLVEQ